MIAASPKPSGEWWRDPEWRTWRRTLRTAKRDRERADFVALCAMMEHGDPDLTWASMAERLGIARSTLCASVSRSRWIRSGALAVAAWETWWRPPPPGGGPEAGGLRPGDPGGPGAVGRPSRPPARRRDQGRRTFRNTAFGGWRRWSVLQVARRGRSDLRRRAGLSRPVSFSSSLTARSGPPWLRPRPVGPPRPPGRTPSARSDGSWANRAGHVVVRNLAPIRLDRHGSARSTVRGALPPRAGPTCLSYTPSGPGRSCGRGPASRVATE